VVSSDFLIKITEVDEDTIDLRKTEFIADGQELEQAFQLVKQLWVKFVAALHKWNHW